MAFLIIILNVCMLFTSEMFANPERSGTAGFCPLQLYYSRCARFRQGRVGIVYGILTKWAGDEIRDESMDSPI